MNFEMLNQTLLTTSAIPTSGTQLHDYDSYSSALALRKLAILTLQYIGQHDSPVSTQAATHQAQSLVIGLHLSRPLCDSEMATSTILAPTNASSALPPCKIILHHRPKAVVGNSKTVVSQRQKSKLPAPTQPSSRRSRKQASPANRVPSRIILHHRRPAVQEARLSHRQNPSRIVVTHITMPKESSIVLRSRKDARRIFMMRVGGCRKEVDGMGKLEDIADVKKE